MDVFISYAKSHESQLTVDDLVTILRKAGIQVWIDTDVQMPHGPQEGWIQWMRRKIRDANWVLILFDENYLRAFYGEADEGEYYGSTFESAQITHNLYLAHGRNEKYIPLLPDGVNNDLVPADFGGNRYYIPSESEKLVSALLTRMPRHVLQTRIDIGRLHNVAMGELIDREESANTLYTALEDPRIGVLGIIADGGIGKTSIVLDWLSNLDVSGYGLKHVYAWSFFDTVTRHVTTSDEFFGEVFNQFERVPEQRLVNFPHGKAKYLIDILRTDKFILVLDSLESLQDPSINRRGNITDQNLQWLVRNLSMRRMGQEGRLVIITSRLSLLYHENATGPGYVEKTLENLQPQDGAKLLISLGVRGSKQELIKASTEYEGHCLSLVLLGKLIADQYPDRNISNRVMIPSLVPKPIPGFPLDKYCEHAERVMTFYEKEISQTDEIILLEMMGLFLEPMDASQRDCIVENAVFAQPLRSYSPDQWTALEKRLEKYGLLIPQTEPVLTRSKWDCHQLIREHFRRKLSRNEVDWWDAHGILFQYFQDRASYQPSTREGLRPLYRAVHHGCLAHRFKDALQVYKQRILRDEAQGFSTNRLGAAAEDIACLQGFLASDNQVKKAVIENFSSTDVAWLWARLAFCQTCRGSLHHAINNRRTQLDFCHNRGDLMGEASALENLSELFLLSGDLVEAKRAAEGALHCASSAQDWGQLMRGHCRLAVVHYFQGETISAKQEFIIAKELKEQCGGPEPWIVMDHGFYYRWWLLDTSSTKEQYTDILHDAEGASGPDQTWLAPLALDELVKAIAISRLGKEKDAEGLFSKALQTLMESGFVIHLPYYYNAKVEFDIYRGDVNSALQNVAEAQRIASYYGMPLLLADSYLCEAQIHISTSSPEKAQNARERASNLITNHGYYLRTLELTLLEGQIALLENRKQEGKVILDQARESIDEMGRLSLLHRCYRNVTI